MDSGGDIQLTVDIVKDYMKRNEIARMRQHLESMRNEFMNESLGFEVLERLFGREYTLSSLLILRLLSPGSWDGMLRYMVFVEALVDNHDPKSLKIGISFLRETLVRYTQLALKTRRLCSMETMMKYMSAVEAILPNHMTCVHAIFVSFCVKSRNFVHSYELIMNREPTVYKKQYASVLDIVGYFYYAGLSCVALKSYEDAIPFFFFAVSIPGDLSKIQIDLYKKHILASLLAHGKYIPLPHTVNNERFESISVLLDGYFDLAEEFTKDSFEEFVKKMDEKMKGEIKKDNNVGIAKECYTAYMYTRVKELSTIYAALTLEELRELLRFDHVNDVKLFIWTMTLDGKIRATIDDREGVVRFESMTSGATTADLERYMETTKNILADCSEVKGNIQRNKASLQKKIFREKYLDSHWPESDDRD